MSGRLTRRPGMPAKLRRFHEAPTLVTLALIVAHGGLLLFDSYLRPGLAGITLPFAIGYRPVFTGLGIIARLARGDPRAQLLRPPADRRQDVAQDPPLHDRRLPARARPRVGAGTNGTSPWMLALLTALTAPIVFAFTYRMLPSAPRRRADSTSGTTAAASRVPRLAANP